MSRIMIDRFGMPKIILEEKDLNDVNQIEDMVNGEFLCHKCGAKQKNEGWKALQGYMESEKIKLEKKAFDSLDMKPDESNTRIKMAAIQGFKNFMELPDRLLIQAKMMRERMKENQEQLNNGEE